MSDRGDGPLDEDWTYVATSLDAALSSFRAGTGTSRLGSDPLSSTDSGNMLIAIQKADVVAHSYGGLLTRWYLEQAQAPGGQSGTEFETRRDVRKFIELGTPNLGSPLANLVDEIFQNPEIANSIPEGHIAFLLNLNQVLGLSLPTTTTLRDVLSMLQAGNMLPTSPDGVNPYPFFEDVSVNSEILAQLNNDPFNDDVGYAAVVGTDNLIRIKKSILNLTLDGYYDLNPDQASTGNSYFPYLRLIDADNDSIVPTWSAALPDPAFDTYLPVDHSDLPQNAAVQTQVDLWLNDPDLASGQVQRASLAAVDFAAPVSDRNAYAGSIINSGLSKFGGLNTDALVELELNGNDNNSVSWCASTLGVQHPVITGMLPLSLLTSGITVKIGGDSTLDSAAVSLGNGISVNAIYLLGASPADWVPFRINTLRMGRTTDGEATGPLDHDHVFVQDQISYQITAPVFSISSPGTTLVMPALINAPIVIADNPAGQVTLQLDGGFTITDFAGGPSSGYEVSLYTDELIHDHLLYDVDVSAPAEPTDGWNGLAVGYSYTVTLNHDASGNIVGQFGMVVSSPEDVFQYFKEFDPIESANVTIH